ncbi:hypothetical protein Q5P01_022888 [Channa striata]|uniref:Uncharacterized protein n=1 Tax=Channa striata TaxID=64152 RepID=A0AA88LRS4_CHASR|nr:hypothetical protein Q5P01_022888 [Channa striata]
MWQSQYISLRSKRLFMDDDVSFSRKMTESSATTLAHYYSGKLTFFLMIHFWRLMEAAVLYSCLQTCFIWVKARRANTEASRLREFLWSHTSALALCGSPSATVTEGPSKALKCQGRR